MYKIVHEKLNTVTVQLLITLTHALCHHFIYRS